MVEPENEAGQSSRKCKGPSLLQVHSEESPFFMVLLIFLQRIGILIFRSLTGYAEHEWNQPSSLSMARLKSPSGETKIFPESSWARQ